MQMLAAPLGGMKSSGVEGLASVLGSWLPMGGGAGLPEVLRSLAMEFLAKLRAEVDRVLFFGLGVKIKASRDIRRRLVQALSRLGLKPKLLIGRRKHKRKASGLLLRPGPLEVDSWVKPKAGDDRAAELVLGQGESSQKASAEGIEDVPVSKKASLPSRSSKLCYSREVPSDLVEVAPKMDPVLVPVLGKVAMNRSLPEFALVSSEMGLTSTEMISLVSPAMPSKILAA
jgi:hypothetical protein